MFAELVEFEKLSQKIICGRIVFNFEYLESMNKSTCYITMEIHGELLYLKFV